MGSTNSKPHVPVIMIDRSETLSGSQVQFITLFFGGAQLYCTLYQAQQAPRVQHRNTKPQSSPIYYTLFWRCTTVLHLLPATARSTNSSQKKKPISWAKPAHFDFFTINFTVWSHILMSTGGDALSMVVPGQSCKTFQIKLHCVLDYLTHLQALTTSLLS
jgi:hypothetical protein